MLIQILKHTPPWVFVLFFVLLALGCYQAHARTVSRGTLAIIPAAMIGLSFYGVVSAFGVDTIGLACWAAGAAVAVWLGARFTAPQGVAYSPQTGSFMVPGSWVPLALMMAIYFTKFAVGVMLARQLPIAREAVFAGAVSLCYGLFSGLFLARAIVVWRAAGRAAVVRGAGLA